MQGRSEGEVDGVHLRRWLMSLQRPDQLVDPEMRNVLRAHGRLPESDSPLSVGQAGVALLTELIERLKPPDGASRDQQIPYLVLKTCFLDGMKLFQAAGQLGISERQMSRERARALGLLKAELENAPARTVYLPEPIPTIRGFLPRPALGRMIQTALESHHRVNVHGPQGIGKTSLIAEIASRVEDSIPVLWYRFRPGVNVSIRAFIFEISQYLGAKDSRDLSNFLRERLNDIDIALATRLAVEGLSRGGHLIVLDDYQHAEEESSIEGLLDELVARLPQLRVVTISRHRYASKERGVSVEITPLTRTETASLLRHLSVHCSRDLVSKLHIWTEGNSHLVKLAAAWLKTATPDEVAKGFDSLSNQVEVQQFLFQNITELLDSDDLAILNAASIFRDRFSDDALSYVAELTRGTVLDASLRLVRVYVATRSKEGDSAFFHGSVRDYVYSRLTAEQKSKLHHRAVQWYQRLDRTEEAEYHLERADAAEEEAFAELIDHA